MTNTERLKSYVEKLREIDQNSGENARELRQFNNDLYKKRKTPHPDSLRNQHITEGFRLGISGALSLFYEAFPEIKPKD